MVMIRPSKQRVAGMGPFFRSAVEATKEELEQIVSNARVDYNPTSFSSYLYSVVNGDTVFITVTENQITGARWLVLSMPEYEVEQALVTEDSVYVDPILAKIRRMNVCR